MTQPGITIARDAGDEIVEEIERNLHEALRRNTPPTDYAPFGALDNQPGDHAPSHRRAFLCKRFVASST